MTPGAATRVAAVIGDPVEHSLSPAIHNAAFSAMGLDWAFVAFRVPEAQTVAAIRGAAALGFGGLSVTMPGKHAAAAACDELDPLAAHLGAVNCIEFRDGRVIGHNTDGAGVLYALARAEVSIEGAPVLVLGAGGAAAAITSALMDAGAVVTVAARRPDAVTMAANEVIPFAAATDAAGVASVVVNATPVGMDGESRPVDPAAIAGDAFVLDTIYQPRATPLVTEVRARGGRAANGVAMLVGQAAAAFTQWTRRPAPLDAMETAVADALST